MMMEGKTAVVTGAAHGIGEATALRYAEEGADVCVADLDLEAATSVAKACLERGVDAFAVQFDQRSSASVAEMVAAATARFGRIHVLANVAGIYPGARVIHTTDELWDDVLRNNLTGVFYCCRAVLPDMIAAGGGSIVNIASGAAVKPLEGLAAYSASKGGLASFSRVLALEAAPLVRVNVVAPGPTLTHGIKAAGMATERDTSGIDATMLMERWGRPEEMADMIVFLSSDRASFVTGQMIHVNGGRTMA
ncbi:MAG: SDR family oxidoreductase [Acidimicrobiaceae bacterium]|nr:SDR family oxidoreductase [Acidimicrobiaceae bacterium]